MQYERMTMDEYAFYQQSFGNRVKKVGGTWWAEARPCFFRPLLPFAEIEPRSAHYPFRAQIGGFIHGVPATTAANARINLFVYDEVQQYSLSQLNVKHRYITRKGIKNFEARQLTGKELGEEGYGSYVSFFNRTGYEYKKERLDREYFRQWARNIARCSKVLIAGAYREGRLCAVDISCHVEDIVIDDIFFADTESLSLKVTDFLLHTIREAAVTSDARYLFRGLPTGQPSLDASKLMRGCKIVQLPALLKVNPVALWGARTFMKSSYDKLMGIISPAAPGGVDPLCATN